MKNFKRNFLVALQIIRRDLFVLVQTSLKDDIINALFLIFFSILVFAFMGPLVGLQKQLGVDSLLGMLSALGLFICFIRALHELADLEFTKFIDYRRTLPLSKYWFLSTQIISSSIHCVLVMIPALIFGKLLLWNSFVLTHTNWFMVLPTTLAITGTLASFFVCLQYSVSFDWFKFNIWQRVFAPLQHLGCLFYAWKKVYLFSPWFARLLLLNPMTYCTEGLRASFLGSSDYIPLIICFPIIILIMSSLLLLLNSVIINKLDWV